MLPAVVLPVGISFYTFQNITFIVDAYKGKVKEPDFIRYGVFVSFFPHLIAGPIVHHADIMPQFDRLEKNSKVEDFAAGVCLFAIGMAKKTMIADPLGALGSPMFDGAAAGTDPNLISAWIGVLAYALQIYFDFSAYSDMACGLAMMFGIRLPINFFSPYKSRSIVEFWRRWHMTLSRLLRNYVYIPLGGNRRGQVCRYVNLLATMLIGGLWHGAGWTFVLWGGLHGVYLVVNHAWDASFGRTVKLGFLAPVLTFLAVLVAWVPFRSADFETTVSIYSAMFGLGQIALPLEAVDLMRGIGLDPGSVGDRRLCRELPRRLLFRRRHADDCCADRFPRAQQHRDHGPDRGRSFTPKACSWKPRQSAARRPGNGRNTVQRFSQAGSPASC